MVIVVMGVSGVGKTTVGRELARQLSWPFHDADDLHSPVDIERMRGGDPLTDDHRAPWLAALSGMIGEHARARRPLVLACSALSRSHRAALLADTPDPGEVRLVHLTADAALLSDRLTARSSHFFPPDLLASQPAALEPPATDEAMPVLVLDAAQPADELVTIIRAELDL